MNLRYGYRIILLLMVSSPGLADVQQVSPHGFMVENHIQTAATPAQVWHALTQEVGKWWPPDHTWWGDSGNLYIEARAGGCFCETAGDRQALHMLISFVEPGKLLRMSGGLGPLQGMGLYGALDWQIRSNATGSEVTLSYRVSGLSANGFDQLAPIVDKVQALQLGGLSQHLAGLANAPTLP